MTPRIDLSDLLRVDYVDGRVWVVSRPVTFTYVGPDGHVVEGQVPEGFQTDFASVPRVFWRILPPTGDYGRGAVLHDWLYQSKCCARADADLIFLTAMEALKVYRWKRLVLYYAVRVFGCRAYASQRRELMKVEHG